MEEEKLAVQVTNSWWEQTAVKILSAGAYHDKNDEIGPVEFRVIKISFLTNVVAITL